MGSAARGLHHRSVHDAGNEVAWWAQQGIDAVSEADRLRQDRRPEPLPQPLYLNHPRLRRRGDPGGGRWIQLTRPSSEASGRRNFAGKCPYSGHATMTTCPIHIPQGIYIEAPMARSIVFTSNRSQAVRLPKPVAFPEGVHQLEIIRIGQSRLISHGGKRWDDLFSIAPRAAENFMSERRGPRRRTASHRDAAIHALRR